MSVLTQVSVTSFVGNGYRFRLRHPPLAQVRNWWWRNPWGSASQVRGWSEECGGHPFSLSASFPFCALSGGSPTSSLALLLGGHASLLQVSTSI